MVSVRIPVVRCVQRVAVPHGTNGWNEGAMAAYLVAGKKLAGKQCAGLRSGAMTVALSLIFGTGLPAVAESSYNQAQVVDPTASFVNVVERRMELAYATTPRVVQALSSQKGCIGSVQPTPPVGWMTIPDHYRNGDYGPVNPEEAQAAAPYRELEDAASAGASRYLASGNPAEAVCVANLLSQWAAAKSLLNYSERDSRQAWYQVEWTLSSVSLAWSVVANEPAIPAAQSAAIVRWMHDVAEHMFAEDPHAGDKRYENNHAYWRALCATSVGILASDNKLYRHGLAQYARAIGQMNPDGSFPQEMTRHENALKYQSFALAPLVMIAELAERQGVDLFSLRAHGRTLDDAVNFLVSASANPDLVKQYAAEPQTFSLDSGKNPPAWTEFWAALHPGKPWSDLLTQPLFDANLGGNTTLYVAPTQMARVASLDQPPSSGAR